MKRLITIIALVAVAVVGWAATFEMEFLKYQIKSAPTDSANGTAIVIGLNDVGAALSSIDLVVPSTVRDNNGNRYDVLGVQAKAFYEATNIASFTMYSGYIGERAIAFSKSLKSVYLDGVEDVGKEAFKSCKNLTKATIKSGVLGSLAFHYCESLTTLDFTGVTSIRSSAFCNCDALVSATIPASVTSIADNLFSNSDKLESVSVDDSSEYFTSYEGQLYSKDHTILYCYPQNHPSTTLNVHPSCKELAKYAIDQLNNVTTAKLPYGLETINAYNLYNIDSLKVLELPSTVKTINGGCQFSLLPALTDLYINSPYLKDYNDINSIGAPDQSNVNLHVQWQYLDEFKENLTGFKSYNEDNVVPDDLRHPTNTFMSYTVTSTDPIEIDGETYAGQMKLVRGLDHASASGTVRVSAWFNINKEKYAVTQIDSLALGTSNDFNLTGGSNVRTIGPSAFRNQPMVTFELPNVAQIGARTFEGTKLYQLDLSTSTIETLPDYCLSNNENLRVLALPSTLKTVDAAAFRSSPITKMTVLATTPPEPSIVAALSMQGFTKANCNLYVPYGCKAAYEATAMWSGFKSINELEPTAMKGDLNGDGIIDITDVNMAINMVLGKVDKTTAGDIDGSGDVDITDVNGVINLMLGK